MKCVPAEKWVLLFLTNADTQYLPIKMNADSALVSKNEFLDFYGYTYANRAQFASGKFINLISPIFFLNHLICILCYFCTANEKIYINSTDEDSLKILGFNKEECHKIYEKRKEKYLIDYDDIKTRIRISDKKLRNLKRDDRIIF